MINRISPGQRMSQAVVHGGLLYTSGLVDASAPDVTTQTRQILAKLDDLLARAETNKTRILSVNIWLSDIATFDEMNAVWDAWVPKDALPARATVESKLASPEYKVEISAVATINVEV
jgi:enamine deaminase RidA (YjgF/YER057c/UK114 family)